jgi:hypothetical protein
MSTLFRKLKWSWPWLSRYPVWRTKSLVRSLLDSHDSGHLIVTVANHFEPSWDGYNGELCGVDKQARKLEQWSRQARITGNALRDHDGKPFCHTYFYPGEQYDRRLLDIIADLEADGYGEVEIHLHHGVDEPDTPENLRRELIEFRDRLAEEHKCLSAEPSDTRPRFAFVHGNWALANSMSGQCCGVDNEMEILAETGCYADLTLPSVPLESQGAVINSIYECGKPLNERASYKSGRQLRAGHTPNLPVMITGPLILNFRRLGPDEKRIEDGEITARYPLTSSRLEKWIEAQIAVKGRPEWKFVKLYCHGFFPGDQEATLGDPVVKFWDEIIQEADRRGNLKIHFATAREAFNMIMAAIDGHSGTPSSYRDYKLRPIRAAAATKPRVESVYAGGRSHDR